MSRRALIAAHLAEWSYLIRPYDMLADRRHWRWQRATPCGRQRMAALTPEQRAELEAAVLRHIEREDS